MYSSAAFDKEVGDYIAMVDSACRTADSATLQAMERHFARGCQLEHMFWDQALEQMQWPDLVVH
jgi:thiaminase